MPYFTFNRDDERFAEIEGHRCHTFKVGDRVEYTGTKTPFLVSQTGTVVSGSPNSTVRFSQYYRESLPVMWDDYGYHGVYPHNVHKIYDKPTWEV